MPGEKLTSLSKVKMMPVPTHGTYTSLFLRKTSPGYGYCFRCGMPWNHVLPHDTRYSFQRGCFPLCIYCWELLGSPEARIEYYKMLIDYWEANGSPSTEEEKDQIKRAVANGL